jgi:tetratricopeptide (TPR) repeat protein
MYRRALHQHLTRSTTWATSTNPRAGWTRPRRCTSGHCKEAWGPDHTSTLRTIGNLDTLYADQGKLDEAEKMYQRALQGYEKVLGLENVTRYRPALNTIWNLGGLFTFKGHLDKAKDMFSRAFTSFQALLGPSSNECQHITHSIASLDATQGK